MEDGDSEEPQSGGQRLYQYWKLPNGTQWYHFQLHILHKTAESMIKFISHVCGELQLAVHLSREDRLPKDSWMSDKPQKQTTAKQPGQPSAPIPTWTEYSHRVMVKTVSAAVCMNASFSQIQSQIYHVRTYVAITLCKLHEYVYQIYL